MAINLKLGDRLAIIKDGVKKGQTPQQAIQQYQINKDGGYNNWKNQFKQATGVNPDQDDTYNYEQFFKENPEAAKQLVQGKVSPEILQMYKTPQAIQREKQVQQQRQKGNINSLMDYSQYEKLINDYMNKSVNTPMYAIGGPISINVYANGTSELATSDNPNITEIGVIPEKWSTSIAPDFIEVTPEELQYFTRATMNVPDVVYSDEDVPQEYKDVASKHTKWVSVPWDYLEEKYPNSRRSKDSKHTTYYTQEEVDEDNPKKYYRLYRIRENSPEGRAYEYWKKQQAYEDRQSKEYKYNYGDGEWVDIGTSEVLPEVKVTYNPSTGSYVEEPQEEIITSENTSKPIANSISTSETSPYAQGNSEISYYNPFNAPDGELNVPNNNLYGTEGVAGGSSFGNGTEGIRMPDIFDMNIQDMPYEYLQFEPYEWQQEDLYYLSPPGYVPIPNWDVQQIADTGEEGMDFADFMKSLAGYRDNSLRDELMSKLFEPKDYFADPYAGNHYTDTKSFYDAYNNDPFTKIQRESNGIPLYKNGGRINKFEVGGEPSIEELALQRATKATAPKANYHQAIDFVYGPISAMKMAYDKGVSNCTLTASQFYNPKKPIARAKTITTTPHVAGFYEVGENYAVPGSMVITSLPNGNDYGKNSYHTMILNGYADRNYSFPFKGKVYNVKKGDPLVNYSRGKREPENYVKNIPLSAYLDNSDGKTNVRYYRPYNEGLRAKLLPEIIVTPNGNSIAGGG